VRGSCNEHVREARRDHRRFGELQQDHPSVEGGGSSTAPGCFAAVARHEARLERVPAAERDETLNLVVMPPWTSALGGEVMEDPRHASPHGCDDLGRCTDALIATGLNGRRAAALPPRLRSAARGSGTPRYEEKRNHCDDCWNAYRCDRMPSLVPCSSRESTERTADIRAHWPSEVVASCGGFRR
jgi:hypothetical protein